jgi:hypothetical protein
MRNQLLLAAGILLAGPAAFSQDSEDLSHQALLLTSPDFEAANLVLGSQTLKDFMSKSLKGEDKKETFALVVPHEGANYLYPLVSLSSPRVEDFRFCEHFFTVMSFFFAKESSTKNLFPLHFVETPGLVPKLRQVQVTKEQFSGINADRTLAALEKCQRKREKEIKIKMSAPDRSEYLRLRKEIEATRVKTEPKEAPKEKLPAHKN